MSNSIVIYLKEAYPFCNKARQLLASKAQRWTEIDIDSEPGRRVEMVERSGRRTVPQIFIGDRHIGGFDDLFALDAAGQLDDLL